MNILTFLKQFYTANTAAEELLVMVEILLCGQNVRSTTPTTTPRAKALR